MHISIRKVDNGFILDTEIENLQEPDNYMEITKVFNSPVALINYVTELVRNE